jgi:hypothetical protein
VRRENRRIDGQGAHLLTARPGMLMLIGATTPPPAPYERFAEIEVENQL